MKKLKTHIEPDLAKKKVARYKYWSVRDENGITICSSDDNNDNKGFAEILDKIIADNVDAEVSVKFGTTEQSARQNQPFFIRINEDIEWIEQEEETVSINGQPHKLDKNGNVNINLSAPQYDKEPKVESAHIDYFRQEMEMQLNGMRREHELKEEKMQLDLSNKLLEQTLKFKEMMLADRENRIAEREQGLAIKEAELFEKENDVNSEVKSYLKQVPSALGSVLKDWIKTGAEKNATSLGSTEEKPKPRKRRAVQFEIKDEVEQDHEDPEIIEEEIEEENLVQEPEQVGDQEIETEIEEPNQQENDQTNNQ